jgi:butyrate kinase
MKEITRKSHIHALNQKETAIRHAESLNKKYEDLNLVVAHIGGGISVVAHRKGKMIDGNDIVGGDGPMAPTRTSSLPTTDLVRLCFSGTYTEKELLERCTKNGGLADLLGTSDVLEVIKRIENGDTYAEIVYNAMIYQIIKMIGSMSAVLEGKVDGILLGGGLVKDTELVKKIERACSFIAPVTAYPGEFEMEAMAAGALRVLEGRETVKKYTGIPAWSGFKV